VIGLRIKITDGSPADGGVLEITATDASGDYAGEMQVVAQVTQPDLDMIVQVQEPPSPGNVIFHNHIISIHQNRWDSNYWIDAMLDLYWFDLQLEQATKPAKLTFKDQGLAAEYRVSYEKRVSSGLTTVVGAGETIENYGRCLKSGSIEFETQNQHYPDQSLTIENGALARSQIDGSAFVVEPPLTAKAGGGFVKLGLDVPSLTGESDTVSGTDVATVRTNAKTTQSFTGTAGELDLTFPTDHPGLWATWLEDEVLEAGLTSSSCPPALASSRCQFEVTTTSDAATLEVHGPTATDSDPSNPDRDISLETTLGEIATEVQT
jgi:hypothetical protein